MRKLSEIIPIPIINIWKWADGNEYTIDDDSANVELTPELAESSEKVEVEFENHFKSINTEKGKGKFKVENSELHHSKLHHSSSSSKEVKIKDSKEDETVRDK